VLPYALRKGVCVKYLLCYEFWFVLLAPSTTKGERPFSVFLLGLPHLNRHWNLHSPEIPFAECDSAARRFKLYPCVETPARVQLELHSRSKGLTQRRFETRGRTDEWSDLWGHVSSRSIQQHRHVKRKMKAVPIA
jgi:hypothetical protein